MAKSRRGSSAAPTGTKLRTFAVEVSIIVYRHLPYALHRQDGTVPAAPLVAVWDGKSSRAAHPGAIQQATPYCLRLDCMDFAG